MANDDQPDKPLAPGLYLVATPIGNLEDITLRALRVLRSADRIACEDTRQTQKLLNHFQIKTPTVSYHQHNEAARTEELIARLQGGARIAVVSDAGTPGIADPGAEIAAAAIAAGIAVFPIPGANAALAALVASGLLATNSSRTAGSKGEGSAAFTFHGFLPAKEGQRRTALEALRASEIGPGFSPDIEHTPMNLSSRAERSASALRGADGPAVGNLHIFYEAPHRILATLSDIEALFGSAQHIVLARELTKIHEEFLRGAVSEIRKTLGERATIKGEFVLLFVPAQPECPTSLGVVESGATDVSGTPRLSIAQEVRALMQSEKLSEMDALKRVARARGLSKSAAYREWQRGKSAKS
ncbi:MAG TPA: 16S rRNA (cytidine(1402)-2'-O)-methyltransferase [Acidobacteriaceae bacterium]|nr:16S rRNA (cytidine(1402)-2'-O)-methyltransferase [Acidobacteriaceae bacterium]